MVGAFVILGGGPCGLAAAWELARHGHRPIVLEREPLVGGLCATHTFVRDEGTWRFDLGGHRFVSSDEHLSRWLEGLLGDDLLTQERKSVVLHEGRRFRYPLDARDLIANLGLRENARALAGYAFARARQQVRPSADRTFEDWVVARFGRPLYDTFFGPYTEKLWGIPPARISADWAAERISLLDLGDAALRLAGLRREPIRTYARRYRYPRFGMGQLYDRLAAEVVRLGGEVRTRARVTGLETSGERVTAVRVQDDRGATRVPVAELLSTIPLTELAHALTPSREGLVARATRALRFRSLVFLNVTLRREAVSENTWMYVASGRLRISRIQEPRRRSPEMAPPGRTSMMIEIPCDVGDDVWTADVDRPPRPLHARVGRARFLDRRRARRLRRPRRARLSDLSPRLRRRPPRPPRRGGALLERANRGPPRALSVRLHGCGDAHGHRSRASNGERRASGRAARRHRAREKRAGDPRHHGLVRSTSAATEEVNKRDLHLPFAAALAPTIDDRSCARACTVPAWGPTKGVRCR